MHRIIVSYSIVVIFILSQVFVPMSATALAQSTPPADAKITTGTVVETMNASGYTYMLVSSGKSQSWVAIPETVVKTGSAVSYYEGMVMSNFASKTLNKTFESIIFSAGLVETATPEKSVGGAKTSSQDDAFSAALKAEQKSLAAAPPPGQSSSGSVGAIAPLQEISVPKAEGDNSYTIEEIFAKSKTLNGQKVRIRGKVVKFSPNIMGKNWVHLQDGTGNPLQNSHDLVLTTDTTQPVDAIVIMEGVLAADKDFGAGYQYTAIVEQAVLIK